MVETLVAIFIIVLVLTFLSGSIATASNLNARLKDTPFGINYDEEMPVSNQSVTIIAGNSIDATTSNPEILEDGKVSIYQVHGNTNSSKTSGEESVLFYYYRDYME